MPPIVVIAPESASYQITQRVAVELGLQDKIRLHLTGLSRSLHVARQAEEQGAQVIVVRGWSANQIIEAGIKVPVVFLPISMRDLVYVLNQAAAKSPKKHPRLGFVAYPQLRSWPPSAPCCARICASTPAAANPKRCVRPSPRLPKTAWTWS